ncbi:MAG: hypothetical protein WCJ30_10310, partial [Deltaproteobacteria bacterium]
MIEPVPVLSAGDIALTVLCGASALYEYWLHRQHPAGRRHLSAALVAVATAFYSGAGAVEYATRDASVAHHAVSVQWLALIVIVHAMLSFSVDMTGRPLPWSRKLEAVVGLCWSILIVGTSWALPD